MSTPAQQPQQDPQRGADPAGSPAGERGDVPLADLEELVDGWMTLQEVADHLDLALSQARRLVADHDLVAVRRGRPRADHVPRALVVPVPLPRLRGTAVVLADSGFTSAETLRWLFTPDPSLPGTPVEALRAEHRTTEVRRRAQALAF